MNLKKFAIVIGAVSLTNISAAKADIEVVTSIKPLHSLVSGVMAGVGNPSVIIEGAGSPHTYSLKPSQAKQLQDAKLVFWMGDELEKVGKLSLESFDSSDDVGITEIQRIAEQVAKMLSESLTAFARLDINDSVW